MEGSRIRWAIVVVLIIVLLVLSVWGIFSIARNLFGPRTATTSQSEDQVRKGLDEYNRPGTDVSFELQGPVVGNNDYRAYRITISRTERVFQLIRGYDNSVESEQRFENNEAAYLVLLKSLDGANFDAKNQSPTEDERGACPLGRRYIYAVHDNGNQAFRAWNTSCNRSEGNSSATFAVRTLFQKQIPDYYKLVSNTGLY